MSRHRLSDNFRLQALKILIAVCAVGLSIAVVLFYQPSSEFRRGYGQGYREAELEIEAGKLTRYTSGLQNFAITVDPATGLPLKQVGGCLVDDFCRGRIQGHEERILAHLAEAHPSALVQKNWTDDVNDLINTYVLQAKERSPVRLTADGLSARAPLPQVPLRDPAAKTSTQFDRAVGRLVPPGSSACHARKLG